MYQWVLAFHLMAVICWFAALFYLPRLFVYHAMAEDNISIERFKLMQRKLYRGIANPSMIATVVLGLWLVAYGTPGIYQSGLVSPKSCY
jgi:putative membrane protein